MDTTQASAIQFPPTPVPADIGSRRARRLRAPPYHCHVTHEACCRCYGCDTHLEHTCGLLIEQAERYRLAHDEVAGQLVRELIDVGRAHVADDGTLRATGY